MNQKKLLITLAKIALSVGIIGYLFYSAVNTPEGRDAFVEMLRQPKAWGLLVGGFVALADGRRDHHGAVVLSRACLGD